MALRMPWIETDAMNERVKFISSYLAKEDSFLALCQKFRISRKTGYKWVERYERGGVDELKERSRRPLNHPDAIRPEVIDKILALRAKHPLWGPKKLLVILQRREPQLLLPAVSTTGLILKRKGCIKPKRKRFRSSPFRAQLGSYDRPNAIWCADFKGHFPVGGKRCHPLTITDGYSRYLLRCEALRRPMHSLTQDVFESAFREYGLPDAIRTDNGAPFSTLAPGGLSRLSVWWIKLGIRHERIEPGKPQQNGRHERMHATLKAETARPPRDSFSAQKRAFAAFVKEYNEERPHESLEQEVPAAFFSASTKSYPKKVPEIEYPSSLRVERVYPNGVISVGQTQWYISNCLKNEYVGLEQIDEAVWRVYFGSIALGMIDGRTAEARNQRSFGTMVRFDGETYRNQKKV